MIHIHGLRWINDKMEDYRITFIGVSRYVFLYNPYTYTGFRRRFDCEHYGKAIRKHLLKGD